MTYLRDRPPSCNDLPLFRAAREQERRPAGRRLVDRFNLKIATADVLAELAGFTARDRS